MGHCGNQLYQNGAALAVKDQFEKLFNAGEAVQNITSKLIKDYKSRLGNHKEDSLFWFALADTQWDFGVLLPMVKKKALNWIEITGSILNDQEISIVEKEKGKRWLDAFRDKLFSPPPLIKKSVSKKLFNCEWNCGDVFAYQLESELAKEKGLWGRYFLIQKVDEDIWYPGHIVPIVYVKITKDTNLPSNIEEYNQLEYVQTWFTKYEERFWPIDVSRLQEDIAEKSKINYEVDEYGFLPQYRAKLLNTSKKVIPAKLIYVGDFSNAICPQKEFIPHTKENIIAVCWKGRTETFETKMIKRYCGHNLRQLSIYSSSND